MILEFPPTIPVQKNVLLAPYTNIGIGGPADFLVEISDQNIFRQLYVFCREHDIPFLALGDGTNVFFPKDGFRGLIAIIKFNKISSVQKNAVVAEAGASLTELNHFCQDNALTGLEFTSGIPGTIGGAVYGNAGAYGNDVGNLLTRAKIMDAEGRIHFVERSFFQFRYRHSNLKIEPTYVLQAEFQLQRGKPEKIKTVCDEIIAIRTAKLPPEETKTAGSWFKNIKDEHGNATAAAVYLDAIGSKQTSVGDAAVHHKHANIFYNRGRATASDMLNLEEILRQRVQDEFGITLEREVMYIQS